MDSPLLLFPDVILQRQVKKTARWIEKVILFRPSLTRMRFSVVNVDAIRNISDRLFVDGPPVRLTVSHKIDWFWLHVSLRQLLD